MNITQKIDDIFEQVSNSKFGPIIYQAEEGGKITKLDKWPEIKDTKFLMSPQSFEVFKICLMSVMGFKVKDEISGEDWKQ